MESSLQFSSWGVELSFSKAVRCTCYWYVVPDHDGIVIQQNLADQQFQNIPLFPRFLVSADALTRYIGDSTVSERSM